MAPGKISRNAPRSKAPRSHGRVALLKYPMSPAPSITMPSVAAAVRSTTPTGPAPISSIAGS